MCDKIRVLHVTEMLQAAGIESFIMNVYRNIDRERIQFDFFITRDEKEFYDEYVKEHPYSYNDIKDKDIHDVMCTLKQNGYKIAIASSTPMDGIQYVIKEIGIVEFVDVIVSGEMFQESKPNPEIYNYTLSKLNLKPEECIAIEDSTYGIQAAKGAGITTFAKRDDRFHYEQDMADVVIDDLLQIIRFFKI